MGEPSVLPHEEVSRIVGRRHDDSRLLFRPHPEDVPRRSANRQRPGPQGVARGRDSGSHGTFVRHGVRVRQG